MLGVDVLVSHILRVQAQQIKLTTKTVL